VASVANTRFARHSSCRFFDPSKGAPLTLQVFAFDKYKNLVVDSDRIKAVINGDAANAVDLPPPTYTADVEFPLDYVGEVKIGFVLANDEGKLFASAHLPNSPFLIKVSPPAEDAGPDFVLIGNIVAGVLLVVSLIFYRVYKRHQKKALKAISALNSERVQLQDEQSELKALQSALQAQNVDLQKSLRRKKHSDTELLVMQRAMEEQNDERADELKRVLVDSKDVKIGTLLGQGGMGKVFLAEYKGQQVAVKQLLAINEDNVKRFR